MSANKGDQGDRGIQGKQGIQGIPGERGEVSDALIAGLAGAASDLASAADDLTQSFRKSRIERYILGGLTLISVILSVIAFVNISTLQSVAKNNKSNTELIKDCTTPEGECYERGRTNTGNAIGVINEVTIAAAYCAQFHDKVDAIRACIEAEIR